MQPSDTSPAMAAKQLELLRAAGPARRAGLALRLSAALIDSSRRAIARLDLGVADLLARAFRETFSG